MDKSGRRARERIADSEIILVGSSKDVVVENERVYVSAVSRASERIRRGGIVEMEGTRYQ